MTLLWKVCLVAEIAKIFWPHVYNPQIKEIELLLHTCHFELPFHEQFRQDTSLHLSEQYFAISALKFVINRDIYRSL
jgi:hypothetical protein